MSIDMSAAKGLEAAKLEALIEMMFLAATADEEFDAKERAQFDANVALLSDEKLESARLAEIVETAERALEQSGREARLKALRALLPELELRKLAMALAIQITAADGLIRTSERELILDTAELLDIDRDEAADMVKELSP
jgi:tellurite resistance protein